METTNPYPEKYTEQLLVILRNCQLNMSYEIDNDLFIAVSVTISFMYVMFRLVEVFSLRIKTKEY